MASLHQPDYESQSLQFGSNVGDGQVESDSSHVDSAAAPHGDTQPLTAQHDLQQQPPSSMYTPALNPTPQHYQQGMDNDEVDFSQSISTLVPGGQNLTQDGQQALEQELEVEDETDDSDSALGSDGDSYTTSMSDSIYNYRREHGRTYHAYKDGKYIFPNDDRESDRLDLQHHLFNITFDNRLYHAPVNTNTVRHCLDVGTGTGIWAMDFADQFPSCNVIGTDLSPTQPSFVPPNCSFLIDDMEDEWAFQDKFDLIHGRLLAGCLADWDNFFRQAYENLAPGGWLELQDYGLPVRSFDGTHAGTNIHLWGELLCAAAKQLGRPMGSDACDLYARKMREAGFVDVHELTYMWPSNSWPKDPKMKEIGKWNQVNCIEGLEGFCLALLTRGLGWEKLEVDIFVAKVRQDFMDRKIHTYFPMPVVFGRKPF